MMDAPFVSIVIAVRNGLPIIRRCLEALRRLEYPRASYEVLVVDNGSRDGTDTAVAEDAVRLLREPARGAYAARNTGARAAQGTVLAFTDADCVADPRWLAELVVGFNEGGVGCVAGEVASPPSATPIEEFARRRNLMSQENTLSHPFRPYAITANCAYRTDVFQRLGGFRADMQSGGDAELAWRMQRDLGLRLVFRPQAVVWHHHRTSLRDLGAQSRKYAVGAVDLSRRFDLPRPSLPRRLAGLGLAALRALVGVPAALVRTRGRSAHADVLAPICDVVWRGGEVAGLMRAAWDREANRR